MTLRRTPLTTHKPLVRRTPLARVSAKKLSAAKVSGTFAKPALKTTRVPAVPADVRAALPLRSGGWCEINLIGCQQRATDPSHRIAVGMGGRKGGAALLSARLSNIVHACRSCHDWCHSRPTEAYDMGLFLKEGQDPQCEPLLYRGEVSYLLDDGRVLAFEAVGA